MSNSVLSTLYKLIYSKESLSKSIESLFIVFDISKQDKSKEVNDEQYANIQFIFETCEVSRLDRLIDVNDAQY